ncbi:MAG: hypothetical protein ACYTEL_12485 [Planctomycetota bacterium]
MSISPARGLFGAALLIAMAAAGCWEFMLTPIQPLYITRQPPYVAKLMFPYQQKEKVLGVIVYEEVTEADGCSSRYEARWQIKATEPIPAADYEVTIGHVQPGFEQTVPKQNRLFTPVAGRRYAVEIKTTNKAVTYCSRWCPNIQ